MQVLKFSCNGQLTLKTSIFSRVNYPVVCKKTAKKLYPVRFLARTGDIRVKHSPEIRSYTGRVFSRFFLYQTILIHGLNPFLILVRILTDLFNLERILKKNLEEVQGNSSAYGMFFFILYVHTGMYSEVCPLCRPCHICLGVSLTPHPDGYSDVIDAEC
jgi:hypothetical protein